jgi:hypothetical protein
MTASASTGGTIGVLTPPTPPSPPPCDGRGNVGDLNCDQHTNLQDVSIMLFYFGKNEFPAYLDLNGDGKINLVDFSILLFNWTEQISR